MFKKVSDACDAGPFIGAANMGHPSASDRRIIVPLDEKELQPVGESFLHHRNALSRERQAAADPGDRAESLDEPRQSSSAT